METNKQWRKNPKALLSLSIYSKIYTREKNGEIEIHHSQITNKNNKKGDLKHLDTKMKNHIAMGEQMKAEANKWRTRRLTKMKKCQFPQMAPICCGRFLDTPLIHWRLLILQNGKRKIIRGASAVGIPLLMVKST